MEDLNGKVAVVTGGAAGIGRGITQALLEEGARVVIADIEEPVLQAAVKELGPDGDVRGVVTDVSSAASVEALAADVFGSPVYVLDGEVFWGQDRIELLADALKSGRAPYRSQV